MRIRRLKSLLYIFSSIMFLGLALVSFDTMGPGQQTLNQQSPTPVPNSNTSKNNTPTPAPTQNPKHTATPTPNPTSTPTPSPSPTPTPSLAQLNAAIAIQPATDDIGTGLTTVVTEHLNDYYSNEDLQVKEINNITCYYKEGLADVSYFVYVTYDITYNGSNVPIPAIQEYCVTIGGEAVLVTTDPQQEDVKEALYLSRASESVSQLYIQELIRRYMNAKLACDEALLSSMVTDPSFINIKNIESQTQYIEEYKNLDFIIHSAPDTITEFDYIVYLTHDVKIINIATLAPGMDEFVITLNEQNYPLIFLGYTSTEAEAARVASREQSDYQAAFQEVVDRMTEAMLQDPDLLEFIERINSATGAAE
ncbi:MAG: hypothetical protein J6K04_06905 [Lachnospiraceae bacterium]|nr:hypothetical protein [Lachnospiraceae bacterium]